MIVVVLVWRLHTLLPQYALVLFLMLRRPPRSTLDRSSAASDVYKRQLKKTLNVESITPAFIADVASIAGATNTAYGTAAPVSYTHLRAHETVLDLVCRLLLEKTKNIAPTFASVRAFDSSAYWSCNCLPSRRGVAGMRDH